MKSSRASVVLVLVLAIAVASCRVSVAAARESSSSSSIAAILGRDLRGFIARAGNLFRSDGGGAWRAAANATTTADVETKNLRAVASRRRRPSARKSSGGGRGAGCISAAACRKRRVICGKRCYDGAASSRAASLNHVPSRCVVKCRKCVPTC